MPRARRRCAFARAADPFQAMQLPETIEDFLEHGRAKCLAFNRRGTLLAGPQAPDAMLCASSATRLCHAPCTDMARAVGRAHAHD